MSKSIVFYDQSFPYMGLRPNEEQLQQLSKSHKIVDSENLVLALEDADSLIHMHGSYFPKAAWGAILQFLKRGGGLLHIGGAPFQSPVYKEQMQWIIEDQQTTYHQDLQIHEALAVDMQPIKRLVHAEDIPLFAGLESLLTIEPTFGFVLHVTNASDLPHEGGSSGPMDAHIYPLLKGVSNEGREVAAPAVLIENTKGAYAGGRWIFINQQLRSAFWQADGIRALTEWSEFCASGVTEIWLKPNYACYDPGDRVTLTLQLQTLNPRSQAKWSFHLELNKESNGVVEQVWTGTTEMGASRELSYSRIKVPVTLEAGYYDVICRVVSDSGETRILRQGFWGWDEQLLAQGEPITVDRDYFRKNGQPLPIVGMTYMTSDVARKYLFMPNASVWNKDMAQMSKAGINLIRSGIWTSYRNIMYIDGHPYEEVLRAIDAFILTAKKNNLELTFNFFAFTPEAWEGVNPYLDPRSVEAQKRFIATIVSRHVNSSNVHWDLINEPSMFDPKRIFMGPRTVKDPFEKQAYIEWLRERHGSIRLLQQRWNMTPVELPDFSSVVPPEATEINFHFQDMIHAKKGTRWLDYTLFTMEMHNRWAEQLTSTIKSLQPKHLVTVGQDEGLGDQRPSPFFYAEAVDYTTVHSWWLMDQLVWDGIFSKDTNKPNLIQETGIMYLETPDGRAKRSELELRNILERKYAYALSTGGAGAVQWLWNTNFYMDNVNESNIGALRADGTEKPEADVSYDFGRFIQESAVYFEDRKLEDIVVVFPYSNDFSNRKLAVAATSKLTRVLNYEMKVPFRAVGEYQLNSLAINSPKLIIVPSAHNFSDEAFSTLISHIEVSGGTLLITGPIGIDEYWKPVSRLTSTIGQTQLANVLREERIELGDTIYPVSFGAYRIAEANKELIIGEGQAESSKVKEYVIGKGRLIWCSVPIELNERSEPLVALYRYALNKAGVDDELTWLQGGGLPGIYGRKLSFRDGALMIFVSEYAHDTEIQVSDPVSGRTYRFMLEKERSVLFMINATGQIVSTYRPTQVKISVI
ncbi:MAG: beta-galactosidase [Paenibacillaceae bacterium]